MHLFLEVCAKTDVLFEVTRRTGVQFDRQPFSNRRAQLCVVPLHSSKWKINAKWQKGVQSQKCLHLNIRKGKVCNFCTASTTTRISKNDDCFWTDQGLELNSPNKKYKKPQESVQEQHTYACMVVLFIPFPKSWIIIYDQAFWAGYEFMHAEHCITSCNHKLQLDLILRCMATSDSETSTGCRHYSDLETVWILI